MEDSGEDTTDEDNVIVDDNGLLDLRFRQKRKGTKSCVLDT